MTKNNLYGSLICESYFVGLKTLKQVLSKDFLSFFLLSNVPYDQIRRVYLDCAKKKNYFAFYEILIVSCVVIFSSWPVQAQDVKTD